VLPAALIAALVEFVAAGTIALHARLSGGTSRS